MSHTADLLNSVRTWGNTLTDLVGPGKPLALGFHERRLRSPQRGVYAVVEAVEDADLTVDAEGTIVAARFTFSVYSATDAKAARTAGIALINSLRSLNAAPPGSVTTAESELVMVAEVSGEPIDIVNASTSSDDEPLYRVRGTVYAAPF